MIKEKIPDFPWKGARQVIGVDDDEDEIPDSNMNYWGKISNNNKFIPTLGLCAYLKKMEKQSTHGQERSKFGGRGKSPNDPRGTAMNGTVF